MVHRIQNRNPGYSDFSTLNSPQSFSNFASGTTVTSGANALKVEEELNESEENNINASQNIDHGIDSNTDIGEHSNPVDMSGESLVLTDEVKNQEIESNGLENFGLSDEEPNLFDA